MIVNKLNKTDVEVIKTKITSQEINSTLTKKIAFTLLCAILLVNNQCSQKYPPEFIPLQKVYDFFAGFHFQEGLFRVDKDGKYGFIDKTGKEAIPLIYDLVENFSDGVAVATYRGKKGFILNPLQ